MAHWIIEDKGFGGVIYTCSNCRESWDDYYEKFPTDFCAWCGEYIDEDANVYVEEMHTTGAQLNVEMKDEAIQMKCRDCEYAKRGYFESVPDAYVCIGVKEPFVIRDYPNAECKDGKAKSTIDDGAYMELFAVKNGVRYNAKVINMRDVSIILTGSLMDSIEKLWK